MHRAVRGAARHVTSRTARHGMARHGTARHGTARRGTARHVERQTVLFAAICAPLIVLDRQAGDYLILLTGASARLSLSGGLSWTGTADWAVVSWRHGSRDDTAEGSNGPDGCLQISQTGDERLGRKAVTKGWYFGRGTATVPQGRKCSPRSPVPREHQETRADRPEDSFGTLEYNW